MKGTGEKCPREHFDRSVAHYDYESPIHALSVRKGTV